MSPQNTSSAGTPLARLEFAQRLRELRVPRGFRTARSLARALDIDENRYTRYERAEVEPDLTMIRRICDTLGVTPDALLGASAAREMLDQSSRAQSQSSSPNGSRHSSQLRTTDLETAAWLLAEAAMDLKRTRTESYGADTAAPLASVREIGRLYKALMERPFEAISELLMHSEISKADLPTANVLRSFIDQFVSIIKSRS